MESLAGHPIAITEYGLSLSVITSCRPKCTLYITCPVSVNKPPSVIAVWQALYRHSKSPHWSSLAMVSGANIINYYYVTLTARWSYVIVHCSLPILWTDTLLSCVDFHFGLDYFVHNNQLRQPNIHRERWINPPNTKPILRRYWPRGRGSIGGDNYHQ